MHARPHPHVRTQARACGVSSASASGTGTQDIGVQAGTHEGGSSTNELYKLYRTNIPIQHICRPLLRTLLRTQSYQWISAINCTISNPDNRCTAMDQAVLCATCCHCPPLTCCYHEPLFSLMLSISTLPVKGEESLETSTREERETRQLNTASSPWHCAT